MNLPRMRFSTRVSLLVVIAILLIPVFSSAQEFRQFVSEEYGFTMLYPSTWDVINKPKGPYYKQFRAPDTGEGFRPRIHVAVASPAPQTLDEYVKQWRNGVLEKREKEKEQVDIVEDDKFGEGAGAHYFWVRAFEKEQKIWIGILIVLYKHEQTLVMISCLAHWPTTMTNEQFMEQYVPVFNPVLLSVKFTGPPAPAAQTPGSQPAPLPVPTAPQPPIKPEAQIQTPAVQAPQPPAPQPPAVQAPQPAAPQQYQQPPAPTVQPQPPVTPTQPTPAPKPSGPRGAPRPGPERPSTGIVN